MRIWNIFILPFFYHNLTVSSTSLTQIVFLPSQQGVILGSLVSAVRALQSQWHPVNYCPTSIGGQTRCQGICLLFHLMHSFQTIQTDIVWSPPAIVYSNWDLNWDLNRLHHWLSSDQGFIIIEVVLDWFSKMAHFGPMPKLPPAPQLAHIFFTEMHSLRYQMLSLSVKILYKFHYILLEVYGNSQSATAKAKRQTSKPWSHNISWELSQAFCKVNLAQSFFQSLLLISSDPSGDSSKQPSCLLSEVASFTAHSQQFKPLSSLR